MGTILTDIQVAVTATALEFAGVYRNKQYHEPDFEAVLDRASQAGVDKVMLTGMSIADVPIHKKLAASRPQQCFYTIGVHPYHAAEPEEDPTYLNRLGDAIAKALETNAVVAFGELGLDYDRLDRCPRDIQLRTFKAQLELYISRGFTLPLFLHCRAAFDDFVAAMEEYIPGLPTSASGRHGLVHSFVGTSAQMNVLTTQLKLDISVNGFSFKDRDSIEMVRDVPLEYLQIETDAPWGNIPASSEVARRFLVNAPSLPPSKKRDKFEMGVMVKERNESCCITNVAYIVAGIKGLGVEEVCEMARANSVAMFGLERE